MVTLSTRIPSTLILHCSFVKPRSGTIYCNLSELKSAKPSISWVDKTEYRFDRKSSASPCYKSCNIKQFEMCTKTFNRT